MKLTVQHKNVIANRKFDASIEAQIAALQPALQIDRASVELVHDWQASPAYRARVHLSTPGPDVSAEGLDHTLEAAFQKVMENLRAKIGSRATRRQKRQRDHAPLLRAS